MEKLGARNKISLKWKMLKWRENIHLQTFYERYVFSDKRVSGCKNDAVYFGRMYEYRRISEPVEEREDIYKFRTTAVAESEWGSGEEGSRAAAGVLDLLPAALQPHELDHL